MQEPEYPQGNPRLNAIWASTVEKLKEVVREHSITERELHIAGDFLNRLGQSGFSRSLVDVALAMTSVDATRRVANGTRPNLQGPFHLVHRRRPDGNMIVKDAGMQPRLTLSGHVRDVSTGKPLAGAEVDVWQADADGHYDDEDGHLRGIVVTEDDGSYHFTTVVPRDYSDHDNDPIGELFRAMGRHNRRAAHVHIKIRHAGVELLTTQLFMPGSPYLDSDYVEGAVSPDLILDLASEATLPGEPPRFVAHFDFAVVVPQPALAD
ncbi:MAG: hydroxyquinol 1,2-dioxygenase [Bradyrhizobium sp.]|nr:hydroxyquinol 1,2-dioxygenase [Bradyrhizobium sp.]